MNPRNDFAPFSGRRETKSRFRSGVVALASAHHVPSAQSTDIDASTPAGSFRCQERASAPRYSAPKYSTPAVRRDVAVEVDVVLKKYRPNGNCGSSICVQQCTSREDGLVRIMLFRFRLWTRFKLALRKRPVPQPRLPYDLDEFAGLLSSQDPNALKELASGLARSTEVGTPRLQA
jgi:hypothetical protein